MRFKVLKDRASGRVIAWQTRDEYVTGPMVETDETALGEVETTRETLEALSGMQAPPPALGGLLGELDELGKAAGKKPGDPVTFGDVEAVARNRNGGKH